MSKRYYFGANTLSTIVPAPVVPVPPVLVDWTLTLVSATPEGVVTYTVPNLDATAFNKPDNIIVAYIPGATLDAALSAEAVLALPGVAGFSSPFPPSFGAIGLDQTVVVTLPAPLPVGPVVVVIVGEFVSV
jgi:hypothetical protein